MSNPGDPGRPPADRGYYGAGWSQPAPPAQPSGAPGASGPSGAPVAPNGGHYAPPAGQYAPPAGQYAPPAGQYGPPAGQYAPQGGPGPQGGPYAPGNGQYGAAQGGRLRQPPRPSRTPGDPRRAFAPGASVTNTAGALIAVVSIVLVEFVSGLFALLGASFAVHPFAPDGLLRGFVDGVFASTFPFYAGAFLALAFLTPVDRRSPLPTVLLRAVLAGVAGTVALALVGVVTGTAAAVRSGGARLVVDVVTTPLQDGVPFTLMLIATCTGAWLWLGRPRGRRSSGPLGAPGTPGTVRPADAVPPATVQPDRAPRQQPGRRHGPTRR